MAFSAFSTLGLVTMATKTERLQALIDDAHDEDDEEFRHWWVQYIRRSGNQRNGFYADKAGWYLFPNEPYHPGEHIYIGQWYRDAKVSLVNWIKLLYLE